MHAIIELRNYELHSVKSLHLGRCSASGGGGGGEPKLAEGTDGKQLCVVEWSVGL